MTPKDLEELQAEVSKLSQETFGDWVDDVYACEPGIERLRELNIYYHAAKLFITWVGLIEEVEKSKDKKGNN